MLRIAGVDPDTKNVTIAWFDSETKHGYTIVSAPTARKSLAEHRFLPLYTEVTRWLVPAHKAHPFDFVYIEKPMFTRNAAATIWQSAVMGMLRCALADLDIPHQLVDPGIWKKETIGAGNANKEDVAVWAQVNLRLEAGLPQDVYDAYCIAWHGYLKTRSPGGS